MWVRRHDLGGGEERRLGLHIHNLPMFQNCSSRNFHIFTSQGHLFRENDMSTRNFMPKNSCWLTKNLIKLLEAETGTGRDRIVDRRYLEFES